MEERTHFRAQGGPFAFYRLHKKSIGTPEAIQVILRTWNLSRQQVSYGGLKDRHAVTSQYITIFQGPAMPLRDRSLELEYLGQAGRAFSAEDIESNQFRIALRGIRPDVRDRLAAQAQALQQGGLVNYFDDQRFGSLGYSGEFIGRPWCQGNYERVLFLAMADPNSHDRPREKEQKQILRDAWGDWQRCKQELDRSHRRSIVTYLCDHPTDFRRAIALIRIDLRSIYVAAFQSFLWNMWLSKILVQFLGQANCESFPSRCGELFRPKQLTEEQSERLASMELPLPSARQKDYPLEWVSLLDEVLAQQSLVRHELRFKYPRDTFFSKGKRAVWLRARKFQSRFVKDEIHTGCEKMEMEFDLPKGAYATMIVKHLSQVVENDGNGDNEKDSSRQEEDEHGES